MTKATLDLRAAEAMAREGHLPNAGLTTAPNVVALKPRTAGEGDLSLGRASNGDEIALNLAKLIAGRALIQGNSGAGKSMLLRRIFEKAFGKVQQLLLDPDGEFSTLREQFDVAVLTAADIERIGGRAFAHHLREHRYSAVVDLSDATTENRLSIAAEVAAGLIDAPEQHWAPLLVLIDEAQTLAPHYDTGDTDAETRKRAIASLADMMGRGRKRGVAGVIATQRIAETSKAVVSKATNIIVGRTVFDRDLERAGGLLGFTVGHSRTLRSLADGEFVALGPAFGTAGRIRFKAGPALSRHKGAAPTVNAPPAIGAAQAVELLAQVPAAAGTSPINTHRKRGRRGRDWSELEDRLVREGYRDGLSLAKIAGSLAVIGREVSISMISTRAHQLGLVSATASVGWTDAEDHILRDAYEREVRIIDICGLLEAQGFHRGRVSVQMRAIALGITRDRVNYWTEPEKEIALQGLRDGTPYREIVAQLNAAGYARGMTSIFKFAQKNNFDRSGDSWTPDQLAELKRLYDLKTPVKEIAEKLGKPIGSVRTRASNLGLRMRQPWSEQECELLRAAHEDGVSLGSASQRIGRPYTNVARMATELGLNFKANRVVA